MASNLDPAEEARRKGQEIKKEIDRKNGIYARAQSKLELEYSEAALREAAELFAQIPGWRDSDAKKVMALQKADEVYNETVYKKALKLAERGDAGSLGDAVEAMKKVSAWRDAVNKAEEFELAFQEIKKKELKKREEKERTERNRVLYAKKYDALLASEDKVGAELIETVEKLKIMENDKNAGIYIFLNFFAVVISVISFVLWQDGNDSWVMKAGVAFAPLTIVLSIVAAIARAVKKNRLENRCDELSRIMRKIRQIPDFEEFNKEDHEAAPSEAKEQEPKKERKSRAKGAAAKARKKAAEQNADEATARGPEQTAGQGEEQVDAQSTKQAVRQDAEQKDGPKEKTAGKKSGRVDTRTLEMP